MKSPVRFFKFIMKNSKEIRSQPSREFFRSVIMASWVNLDSAQKSFILENINKEPTIFLKDILRNGKDYHLDSLISTIPNILQYERALKILNSETTLLNETQKSFHNNHKNLITGAMLISKLSYSEKDTSKLNLDTLIANEIEKLSNKVQSNIELELKKKSNLLRYSDKKRKLNQSKNNKVHLHHILRSINRVINLNKMYLKRRAKKEKEYLYLLDQFLQSKNPNQIGIPVLYSVVYSYLVNNLNFGLEADGVSLEKFFFTRFEEKKGYIPGFINSQYRNRFHSKFFSLKPRQNKRNWNLGYINKGELLGRWICLYIGGIYEVEILFNSKKKCLEILMIDNDCPFIKKGKIFCQIGSPNQLLKANQKIKSNFFISNSNKNRQKPQPNFISGSFSVKSIPYSILKLLGIKNSFYSEKKHFLELFLTINHQHTDYKNLPNKMTLIQAKDLNKCLFEFSHYGISTVTPSEFMDYFYSNTTEKSMQTANGIDIASRLVKNIFYMKFHRNETKDTKEYIYWCSIQDYLNAFIS